VQTHISPKMLTPHCEQKHCRITSIFTYLPPTRRLTWLRFQFNGVSLLLHPCACQLYCTESPHLPGQPVTAVVLWDKIHEPCYFILQYTHAKSSETQYTEHTLTVETTPVIMQCPGNFNRYPSILM
jgi:hypothetical protein